MKPHYSLKLLTASALSLAVLNSCYFNSAGHLFDKASHKSAVNMADLKPGSHVYADDGTYYVELPRYRAGMPVRTQYSIGEQKQLKEELKPTGDSVMVEIPQNYAMYLTGRSGAPKKPAYVQNCTKAADTIKTRSQILSTVRTPQAALSTFQYTSPAAAGWYTLGVLDWLCVDLPITCIENSLMICGVSLVVLNDQYVKSKKRQEEEQKKIQEIISNYERLEAEKMSSQEAQYMQHANEEAKRNWLNAGGDPYDYNRPYSGF